MTQVGAPPTVGVFGGSFNPPHRAHTDLCRCALEMDGGMGRIVVVPAWRHAFGKDLAPFEDRIAMARLAFAPFGPAVEVSAVEKELDGISYTIDTVRELARRMPGTGLRLLVGGDIVGEWAKWKEVGALVRLAPPIVFPRAGLELPARLPVGAVVASGCRLPAISSTELRGRLRSGGDPGEDVTPAVAAYIRENRIY